VPPTNALALPALQLRRQCSRQGMSMELDIEELASILGPGEDNWYDEAKLLHY
jgi:hypothetical protein